MSENKKVNKQHSAKSRRRRTTTLDKPGPLLLKPQRDPGDENPPDSDTPPVDPCRERSYWSQPALAVQLVLKIGGTEYSLSNAQRQLIKEAVHDQFIEMLPYNEPEVSVKDSILTVAVWGQSIGNDVCLRKARDRSIANLKLTGLTAGNNFGFYVNESLVEHQAGLVFRGVPKQYDAQGKPNSSGPIHLTGLAVVYEGPNKVKTLISGYDTRTTPDAKFMITMTDSLLPDLIYEPSSDLDIQNGDEIIWVALLSAVFLKNFFPLAGAFEAYFNQPDNPKRGGVGSQALGLVPREIPLPGNQKLIPLYVLDPKVKPGEYHHGKLREGGVFLPGVVAGLQTRQPVARITGPVKLAVAENMSTTFGFFTVDATDTFGALSISWSSASDVKMESPTQKSTKITFERGNRKTSSSPFSRTLRATVTDQDGFTQTLTHDVEISVVKNLSATCRERPWLEECHGELSEVAHTSAPHTHEL